MANEYTMPRDLIVNALRDKIKTAISEVLHNDVVTTTCISCLHFKEHEGELCHLYRLRPPARIIALGCPEYVDNMDIPF